ncbi:MAG: hypothetical protein ABGX04_06215 [Myxococcales bacterium]|nr:hypothetical protein [Myxococcales bacterium]HIM02351.1 hypothetical protein [Myxococcales bacterium]
MRSPNLVKCVPTQSKGSIAVSIAVSKVASTAVLLTLLASMLVISLGCGGATSGGPDGSSASSGGAEAARAPEATRDGLIKVAMDGSGDLFLRPDHGIGGYDAIVIAPAFVTYRRTSARLDPDDEEVYLVSLEQALLDEANSIGVPIEYEIGECVIKIGIGFLNVDLAKSAAAEVLGEMILVIEYQDSLSGESLLRLMVPKTILRESGGMTRAEHVSASFDRMIDEVNITNALRSATATPSKPRPGCEGRLVNAGLPSGAN